MDGAVVAAGDEQIAGWSTARPVGLIKEVTKGLML